VTFKVFHLPQVFSNGIFSRYAAADKNFNWRGASRGLSTTADVFVVLVNSGQIRTSSNYTRTAVRRSATTVDLCSTDFFTKVSDAKVSCLNVWNLTMTNIYWQTQVPRGPTGLSHSGPWICLFLLRCQCRLLGISPVQSGYCVFIRHVTMLFVNSADTLTFAIYWRTFLIVEYAIHRRVKRPYSF